MRKVTRWGDWKGGFPHPRGPRMLPSLGGSWEINRMSRQVGPLAASWCLGCTYLQRLQPSLQRIAVICERHPYQFSTGFYRLSVRFPLPPLLEVFLVGPQMALYEFLASPLSIFVWFCVGFLSLPLDGSIRVPGLPSEYFDMVLCRFS